MTKIEFGKTKALVFSHMTGCDLKVIRIYTVIPPLSGGSCMLSPGLCENHWTTYSHESVDLRVTPVCS